MLGCVSFAVGGPLVTSLVWPAVTLVMGSLLDGPSWERLKVSAGMVPIIFFGSFLLGFSCRRPWQAASWVRSARESSGAGSCCWGWLSVLARRSASSKS